MPEMSFEQYKKTPQYGARDRLKRPQCACGGQLELSSYTRFDSGDAITQYICKCGHEETVRTYEDQKRC